MLYRSATFLASSGWELPVRSFMELVVAIVSFLSNWLWMSLLDMQTVICLFER